MSERRHTPAAQIVALVGIISVLQQHGIRREHIATASLAEPGIARPRQEAPTLARQITRHQAVRAEALRAAAAPIHRPRPAIPPPAVIGQLQGIIVFQTMAVTAVALSRNLRARPSPVVHGPEPIVILPEA